MRTFHFITIVAFSPYGG